MDKLGPYFQPAGRFATMATLLLPAVAIVVLWVVRRKQLEDMVAVSTVLRIFLIIHAVYFSILPLMFEGGLDLSGALLDKMGLNSFGHIPEKPDNLFWQMTNLCGELFFVATVAYLVMATLNELPRWTLLIPLAQVTYNLKNSLVWLVLYKFFSPTKTPNFMMGADFCIIFPCFVVYTLAYLSEKVKQS
uniref:EXPERA domain-containing protein n=1 Tax=Hemiselmis andersenii TaxID=464988 RepID=A0A6U2FMF1_HEMAN|mmetsp:Transcript_32980/g.77081  ORF Transcript_32980/g.77081 Transcript_32980/m.77081 type:complete len:189 (+) Transcript_32980:75-641(+)